MIIRNINDLDSFIDLLKNEEIQPPEVVTFRRIVSSSTTDDFVRLVEGLITTTTTTTPTSCCLFRNVTTIHLESTTSSSSDSDCDSNSDHPRHHHHHHHHHQQQQQQCHQHEWKTRSSRCFIEWISNLPKLKSFYWIDKSRSKSRTREGDDSNSGWIPIPLLTMLCKGATNLEILSLTGLRFLTTTTTMTTTTTTAATTLSVSSSSSETLHYFCLALKTSLSCLKLFQCVGCTIREVDKDYSTQLITDLFVDGVLNSLGFIASLECIDIKIRQQQQQQQHEPQPQQSSSSAASASSLVQEEEEEEETVVSPCHTTTTATTNNNNPPVHPASSGSSSSNNNNKNNIIDGRVLLGLCKNGVIANEGIQRLEELLLRGCRRCTKKAQSPPAPLPLPSTNAKEEEEEGEGCHHHHRPNHDDNNYYHHDYHKIRLWISNGYRYDCDDPNNKGNNDNNNDNDNDNHHNNDTNAQLLIRLSKALRHNVVVRDFRVRGSSSSSSSSSPTPPNKFIITTNVIETYEEMLQSTNFYLINCDLMALHGDRIDFFCRLNKEGRGNRMNQLLLLLHDTTTSPTSSSSNTNSNNNNNDEEDKDDKTQTQTRTTTTTTTITITTTTTPETSRRRQWLELIVLRYVNDLDALFYWNQLNPEFLTPLIPQPPPPP